MPACRAGKETGSQRVCAVSVGGDLERLSNGSANDHRRGVDIEAIVELSVPIDTTNQR